MSKKRTLENLQENQKPNNSNKIETSQKKDDEKHGKTLFANWIRYKESNK